MGYGGRGVKLTTHLHPAPRLSEAVPLLALHDFVAWKGTALQSDVLQLRPRFYVQLITSSVISQALSRHKIAWTILGLRTMNINNVLAFVCIVINSAGKL
jgi:hypothetical protein